VIKLARRIATDAQRRAPAGLGGKYEDLVSFLLVQAMQAIVRLDPTKLGPNYSLASYICDVMEHRVPDFYRRKAEGFGDRRSGADNRIVLMGDKTEDFDANFDFEQLMSDRRLAAYSRAAKIHGLELADWIVISLDLAARHAERDTTTHARV
jgi:hypothetical protein